jgi:hypothetical protein
MTESPPSSPPAAIRALSPALPTRAGLKTGLITGILLALDMVAALFAANRMPVLESHALERNIGFCGVFLLIMAIPIGRFLNRPVQLFGSAMLGWSIFIVSYNLAGVYFVNLFQVLRAPLDALLEGAVVYGVIAVASWVAIMILQARKQPLVPRRRRTDFLHDHQP